MRIYYQGRIRWDKDDPEYLYSNSPYKEKNRYGILTYEDNELEDGIRMCELLEKEGWHGWGVGDDEGEDWYFKVEDKAEYQDLVEDYKACKKLMREEKKAKNKKK